MKGCLNLLPQTLFIPHLDLTKSVGNVDKLIKTIFSVVLDPAVRILLLKVVHFTYLIVAKADLRD